MLGKLALLPDVFTNIRSLMTPLEVQLDLGCKVNFLQCEVDMVLCHNIAEVAKGSFAVPRVGYN